MPHRIREPDRDNSQREPERLPKMVARDYGFIALGTAARNGLGKKCGGQRCQRKVCNPQCRMSDPCAVQEQDGNVGQSAADDEPHETFSCERSRPFVWDDPIHRPIAKYFKKKFKAALKDGDEQVFHKVSNVRRHQSEPLQAIQTSWKWGSQAGGSIFDGQKTTHLTAFDSKWLQINALACFDTYFREPEIAIDVVETHFREPETGLDVVESHFWEPETSLDVVERHFREPETGLDVVERHFREPETGLDVVERHFWEPETGLDVVERHFREPKTGLDVVERHFGKPKTAVEHAGTDFLEPKIGQNVVLLAGLRVGLDDLFLLQLFQLGRDDHLAVAGVGIVLVVLLVVVLGLVEFLERHDFRDDGVFEAGLSHDL